MRLIRMAALLFLCSSLSFTLPATAQAPTPSAVMDAYTAAINAKNAEAAVAFVAESATYERPVGAFVGRDQVRGFVESLIAQNARVELIGKRTTDGDRVAWFSRVTLDSATGPVTSVNMSSSVVQNGLIVHHQASRLPTEPVAVIDAYTNAINNHDADVALLFVSDEAVYHRPGGLFGGRDEIRGFIQDLITQGVRVELIGERTVEGERVSWTSRVTFASPAPNSPAQIQNNSESIVRDGKIIEHRATRQP